MIKVKAKCLRKYLDLSRINLWECRILYNEELNDSYVTEVKSRVFRWAGHVARPRLRHVDTLGRLIIWHLFKLIDSL
jgi:hypothetical protein